MTGLRRRREPVRIGRSSPAGPAGPGAPGGTRGTWRPSGPGDAPRYGNGGGGPADGSRSTGRAAWTLPPMATMAAAALAIGALLLIQLRAGLFAQSAPVVALGLTLTVAAAAVTLAWPGGGGVVGGVGLSAAGVTQAMVIAADGAPPLLALVLGLWLPAAAVSLALSDEDQRARLRSLGATGRRPGRPTVSVRRRAVRSALGAAALVAVTAALAAALIRPPGRGGSGQGNGRDWNDLARAGRPATSLGIYQADDRLDTARRFELSDEVVMRVRADAPDFWRGTSYDHWDGRAWTRTVPTSPEVDDPPGADVPPAPVAVAAEEGRRPRSASTRSCSRSRSSPEAPTCCSAPTARCSTWRRPCDRPWRPMGPPASSGRWDPVPATGW